MSHGNADPSSAVKVRELHRLARVLARLEDEIARLEPLDRDAANYVERAASCLRERLAIAVA